jgi:NAD-dependent dihydropyrimidine dehydrogenase PreA subunit
MRGDAEIPVADELRCVGSGACVAVCPAACLEMRWGMPRLARPSDCVSCGLCVAVCPVEAIRMIEVRQALGADRP